MKEWNMPRIVIFVLTLAMGSGLVSLPPLSLQHSAHAASEKPAKGAQKYTCPMHPHYIANEMGNCPICGMDLVPLATGEVSTTIGSGEGKRVSIVVAPETIQSMGVRTAKVEKTSFGREIRAYGIVKENEKLQTVVSNRLDGWVEELKVRAVGDRVTKGMLLYKVYSPELFVSQRDYLSTIKGKGRNAARSQTTSLRLRSYGVQPKALRELARRGKVMMKMPFYAQSDGVVSELSISPGSFIKRGSMIAKIQDYSKVWLMVSIAEQDLGFLKEKSQAQVTFPTLKGRKTSARIDYIYPTVDTDSRTGQVRLVIDNKEGLLRPGTYADVVFKVGKSQRLAVPTESLLRSETSRHVIVAMGDGRFEPRTVKTGLIAGGLTEIVEGLGEEDEIVVSGQFLLDSESALRESFRKLERLQTPLPLLDLDKNQMAMVDHLVDAALYLHESQVDGYDVDAKFLQPALEIRKLLWPKFQHTQLAPVLQFAEQAIGKAQNARTASALHASLNELVGALNPWMREGKAEYYKAKGLNLFEEQKGKKSKGRIWIQQGSKPLNPYGNKQATLVAWPADSKAAVAAQKDSKENQAKLISDANAGEMPANNAMRGSHGK